MNSATLYMAAHCLSDYYSNSDEIVKTVMNHAAMAAGSAALSGCLPGTAGAAAAAVSLGVVAKMYVSLGGKLGIRLNNGLIRALASAVVADLAGSVAAMLGVATLLSLVPGMGTLGAAGIVGLTSFCYVYLAGVLYIKMVAKLLETGKSIESMTKEELEDVMHRETDGLNMKSAVKEATSAFKASKA